MRIAVLPDGVVAVLFAKYHQEVRNPSVMKICYVIDDINFRGGAHIATSRLLPLLMARECVIDILTDSEPDDGSRQLFSNVVFRVARPPMHNLRWLVRGLLTKFRIGWFPVWTIDPDGSIRQWLEQHDVVCVQSELSKFRHLVSTLRGPVRKVQLIHTDYANWANFMECGVRGPSWFRRVSARWDCFWYKRMDVIAVIGEDNAEKMRRMMPRLAHKICSFHNLFYSEKRPHVTEDVQNPIRLISLTRVHTGAPKCCEWYLSAAIALNRAGLAFDWTIYGDGRDIVMMRRWVDESGLSGCVHLPGHSPTALAELAKADLTILLSAYEGLPNVIYESLLSGTPVFSTDVGGVREMISDGETGWIAPASEREFCKRLVSVLKDRKRLLNARENLRDYSYDNDAAICEHLRLLGIDNREGNH